MLAAMKLGAVTNPASTLLTPADLSDRFERGRVRHVIASAADAREIRGTRSERDAHRRRRAAARWRRYDDLLSTSAGFTPDGADRCRRSAAPVFHLGNDGEAEARAAFAPELSGRQPVQPFCSGALARRCAFEHVVARLGEARLELFFHPLARRRHRLHRQPAALQRARDCWTRSRPTASPLCARRQPCGGCSCRRICAPWKTSLREVVFRRRTAQPRGHRAGESRVGADRSAISMARPKPPARSATRRDSR